MKYIKTKTWLILETHFPKMPQGKTTNSCSLAGTKKAQNWLGRQLSGRRSPNNSYSDGEFETVIAASAFAVTSAEEVDSLKQKKAPAETRQTSLSKGKSSKEDKMSGPPDARKASKGITGKLIIIINHPQLSLPYQ